MTPATTVGRLFWWAIVIVFGHASVVAWHLFVVTEMHPGELTAPFLLFLGTINLLPFIALALLRTSYRQLAGWLLLVPFGLAVAAGVLTHFATAGPDHVFRMAAGPWSMAFRFSAALLVVS